MNFNLAGVGATPTKSTYDSESAVREMLSRIEKQGNYPAMGINQSETADRPDQLNKQIDFALAKLTSFS